MQNYVLAHASDPDGIISHALARRQAQTILSETTHYFVEHSEIPSRGIITLNQALELVLDQEAGIVTIADMSFSSSLNEKLLQDVARKHDARWYDHHNKTLNQCGILVGKGYRVFVDPNSCAARIFERANRLNSPYEKTLAEIAMVHDFQLIGSPFWPVAEVLEDVIKSGLPLDKLVDDLANEQVLTGDFLAVEDDYGTEQVRTYRQDVATAITKLHETVDHHPIYGRSVAVAQMDKILYMKRGMRELVKLLERDSTKAMPDFSILFTKDFPQVLMEGYSEDQEIVPPFCAYMGGDGRQSKGGFSLPDDIADSLCLQEQVNYVERQFANFLSSQAE